MKEAAVKKHPLRLIRITTVPISLQLLLTGQFRYMIENGYEVVTISADGPGVDDVLKEGARHIAIPFTRKITPWQDLKCLFQLISVIRELKPDIVHTHTPKAGLLGMMAARICRVPVRMHTVAGLPVMEAKGMKRKLLALTEKITYACADKVYPNSRGLLEFMVRDLGVNPGRLSIIGKGSSNGIDTTYFRTSEDLRGRAEIIRTEHGVGERDIVFTFIGRVVRDKGIVELVNAFRSLSLELEGNRHTVNSVPNIFLLIVGPFEQDLDPLPEEVMAFLRTDPGVIAAGFQKDVRPWLLASDVFVFPSYREGFPNVVMQACSLEVPCIVSDINGCNEIIEDKVNGLIVPAKDVLALTSAMRDMLNNASMRLTFASRARQFVVDNFERKNVWEELRKEYESRAVDEL